MALLPVHSQNFAYAFKTACRRTVTSSEPVPYRGQVLTPRLLRRTGNCPPPTRKELMAQPNNSSDVAQPLAEQDSRSDMSESCHGMRAI